MTDFDVPTTSTRRGFIRLAGAGAAAVALAPILRGTTAFAANDYPWANSSVYRSGLNSELGFVYRNCTDFAMWRLNKQVGITARPWRFTWGTLFNYAGSNGSAAGWRDVMSHAGYACDASPRVGAVAWWLKTQNGNPLGHVAIVTAVRPDGSVDTEAYDGFTETYAPQTAVRADAYLHVADIGPAVPSVAEYAGQLVQWIDEKPAPVTTWLVGPDLTRTWVPDGGTYNWMKVAGAPGPTRLTGDVLNLLTDRTGVRAITTDQLGVNWSAPRGTTVWSTANGFALVFQGDGNLVVYAPGGRAVWATFQYAATRLVVQSDGNMVLYSATGAVWSSGTVGQGRSRLVMQADGNLVLYRADGRATWATMTNGGTNRLGSPAGVRLV